MGRFAELWLAEVVAMVTELVGFLFRREPLGKLLLGSGGVPLLENVAAA